MELIGRGRCAEIFRLDNGHVAKVYDNRFTLDWVKTAAERAQRIASVGPGAPAVYGTDTFGDLHAMVMEHIEGVTMWEALLADPSRAQELGQALATLQLHIHASPIDDLPSGLEHMVEKVERCNYPDAEVTQRALDKLNAGMAEPMALAHGDLHPANVMVQPDGTAIAIDWDFPMMAPKANDVARAVYLLGEWALAPGTDPGVEPYRKEFTDAFLQAYIEGSDVTEVDVDGWRLPHVLARFVENISEEVELLNETAARLTASS